MINRRGFLSSFAGAASAATALGFSPEWGEMLSDARLGPGTEPDAPKLPDRVR